MPTFREVNTGQYVNVDDAGAAWFRERARWEEISGEPKAEEVSTTVAETEAPKADADADAPALPDADADRDEWVAYALANGKTDADVKGTRTATIRGWFDAK